MNSISPSPTAAPVRTQGNVGLRFRGNTHSKAEKAYRTEVDGGRGRDSHGPCALSATSGNCATAPRSIALISMCFRLTSSEARRINNADEAQTRGAVKFDRYILCIMLFPAILCNIRHKKNKTQKRTVGGRAARGSVLQPDAANVL